MLRDEKTGFDLPMGWERIEQMHWLYVLVSEPYVKVGIAGDMQRRLGDYRLHNPHPLTLAHKRRVPRALARQVERRLLETFRAQAIGREWLTAAPAEVIAAAKPIVADAFLAARRIKDRSFGSTDGSLGALIAEWLEDQCVTA